MKCSIRSTYRAWRSRPGPQSRCRGEMKYLAAIFFGSFLVALVSCDREERGFEVSPPDSQTIGNMSVTDLHAGAATQPVITGAAAPIQNEYEENAYALSQGQQLFSRFNCGTCHAHSGGGDIG